MIRRIGLYISAFEIMFVFAQFLLWMFVKDKTVCLQRGNIFKFREQGFFVLVHLPDPWTQRPNGTFSQQALYTMGMFQWCTLSWWIRPCLGTHSNTSKPVSDMLAGDAHLSRVSHGFGRHHGGWGHEDRRRPGLSCCVPIKSYPNKSAWSKTISFPELGETKSVGSMLGLGLRSRYFGHLDRSF